MPASAHRVAQLYLSSRRVAARWIRAGLVQAPPAMLDAIVEWVVATAAATSIEAVDRQIAEQKVENREDSARYDDIQKWIDELRANPSWKLYKDIESHMWHLGGAYSRKLKIKSFQKMTPEKRERLDRALGKELDEMQERLDGRRRNLTDRIEWMEQRKDSYRPFTRPGVKPLSGDEEVTRVFDIDTKGWRYGTDEYLERLNEALADATRNRITGIEEMKAKYPDMADFFDKEMREKQRELETGNFSDWKTIRVTLASKAVQKELAYWSRLERIIRVVIPIVDERYGLHDLEASLPGVVRHELQHMAQSWLAAIAGETASTILDGVRSTAGMPGKDIRTPEFRQHQGPGRSHFDDPDAVALRNKLRQQGVNPKKINWHDLDDIEFYTELSDSIDRFKRNWARDMRKDDRMKDDKVKRAAIRFWTGTRSRQDYKQFAEYDGVRYGPLYLWDRPDKFFAALGSVPGAAAKKRKALSEFVKAVL